jgi:hypothetical protein
MTPRRSSLKRKKMMKYAEIAVVVLLIAAIVTVAIIMYPHPKASDYFVFSDLEAEYESSVVSSTQTINIKRLNLTVMPIGGNATNFTINPGGNTDPLDYYYPQIKNGTKQTIEVALNSPVQSIENGTTYPFTIFVHCDEIEGNVTLQIRRKASDYFIFTDLGAQAESMANSSDVLKLHVLYFTVIPVGGNATEFHIDPGGKTDPLESYTPRIDNGTSHLIEATLANAVQSTKNGNTYPVRIFVYCAEAEGFVTLQIPEENVDVF